MEAPRLVTEVPGPRARALIERDRETVSSSYTRVYPLVVARGEGVVVEDVDGNRFLDFTAGIAVTGTGHCHPEIVEAIREQAGRLIHMSGTDFYYVSQIRLAEAITAVSPVRQPARAFFSNSGTEAVEAAIKLARHHTGRPCLVAFYGAFHGRTLGALSLTASKAIQRRGFGPLLAGVEHVPYPHCARCRVGRTEGRCCLEPLSFIRENLFQRKLAPEEVAAIIVEPVQGEGGYVIPPVEFLQGLRELCDEHGILLIADEVQSGMGRTGRLFAMEHFGVQPDIVCIAKAVASGLPLGITVAPADLMDWPPGAHASTFGGNPVSCAAALATLRLLQEGLVQNAGRMGALLMDGLRRLQDRHPCIGEVRGLGLMIGVELVQGGERGEPDQELRDRLIQDCFQRGLLLLPAGRGVLRFVPPLLVTREQVAAALEIFSACLRERVS